MLLPDGGRPCIGLNAPRAFLEDHDYVKGARKSAADIGCNTGAFHEAPYSLHALNVDFGFVNIACFQSLQFVNSSLTGLVTELVAYC